MKLALLAGLASIIASAATMAAEDYPTKPIRPLVL